jgi:hypothetical protein
VRYVRVYVKQAAVHPAELLDASVVVGYGCWCLSLNEDGAAEFIRKVNAGEMRDKDGKPWPETRAWIAT